MHQPVTSASTVTSIVTASARAAGRRGCASTADSSRSVRLAPSTTATPSRASASAHASPMPEEAPVMTATRPARCILTDDDDCQSAVGGRQSVPVAVAVDRRSRSRVDSSVASRGSPLPARRELTADCDAARLMTRLPTRRLTDCSTATADCRLSPWTLQPALLRDLVAIDSVNPSLVPGARARAWRPRRWRRTCGSSGSTSTLQEAAPGRPNVIGVLDSGHPPAAR